VESTSLSTRPDPIGGPAFAQACKAKGVDEPIAADVAIDMKNLLKAIDIVTCTLVLLPFQIEANKHADRAAERVGFAIAMDFVIARRRNSNDGVTGLGRVSRCS